MSVIAHSPLAPHHQLTSPSKGGIAEDATQPANLLRNWHSQQIMSEAGSPRGLSGSPRLMGSPRTPRKGGTDGTLDLFSKFAADASPRLSETLKRACTHIQDTREVGNSRLGASPAGRGATSGRLSADGVAVGPGTQNNNVDGNPHSFLKTALQEIMRRHAGNASMQEASCNMLSLLFRDRPEAAAKLGGDSELCEDLQAALQAHQSSPGAAKWICSALAAACAGSDENGNLAQRRGLLSDIRNVIERFSDRPDVLKAACSAICEICDRSIVSKSAAGHANLLPTLQTLLETNKENQEIQLYASNAVSAICAGHKNNTWIALRMGLWEPNFTCTTSSAQFSVNGFNTGC